MTRPNSAASGQASALVAVVLGAVAIIAFVAAVTFLRPAGSPSPALDPSPTPVVTPSASPGDPAGLNRIPLTVVDPHEVVVALQDPDHIVAMASSGRAGDGMSVRWHDVTVENVDDSTVRITWVGLPQDDQVDVAIEHVPGGVSVRIVQSAPPPNSDALGFDRVLVVTFDGPLKASDVATEILDRTVD